MIRFLASSCFFFLFKVLNRLDLLLQLRHLLILELLLCFGLNIFIERRRAENQQPVRVISSTPTPINASARTSHCGGFLDRGPVASKLILIIGPPPSAVRGRPPTAANGPISAN